MSDVMDELIEFVGDIGGWIADEITVTGRRAYHAATALHGGPTGAWATAVN